MARSFGTVQPRTASTELKSGEFHHKASDEFFSVNIRGEGAFLRRRQTGFNGSAANVLERRIDYWFGSGDHARSYISRTASGELIELPLTWYSENGGQWAMSPAYDFPQHAGFSRKITYRCMFCHNGYPRIAPGGDRWETATQWPGRLPAGIDCQRCHGPGEDHVEAARRGGPSALVRGSIVNPARLAPDRQMEICLQCHLETTNTGLPGSLLRYGRAVFSYRPGEPLGDYMLFFDHAPGTSHEDKIEFAGAPYRLRKSRCYLESGGSLTCTTCHRPHEAATPVSPICQNCHASALQPLIAKRRHTASADCVGCHMPTIRPSDAVHVTITDHYIRRIPDHAPTGPPVEHNGFNTRPYRGKVVLYYPNELAEPDRELYLAVAQIKNQANIREGIDRLENAIARFRPSRSEFYSDLADAYRHAGQSEKAVALYRQALARDPEGWPAHYGLGMALVAAGDFERGTPALRRAVSLAPAGAEIVKSLAGALASSGNSGEAVSVLRAATATAPDSGDLRNNLGTALLRIGDLAGAEDALREAVRLRPEIPAMHLNLATVLARRGSFPEARYEFERAIGIDSSFAEGHSAYATVLAEHGDSSEARAHFETALRLNPRLWNTHNNLGILLEQAGDAEGAIREYRLAIGVHPEFAAAHYNLGSALATQGGLEEAQQHLQAAIKFAPNYYEAHLRLGQLFCARKHCDTGAPHFRKALESPDPKVRKAALDALNGTTLQQ